MNKYVAGQVITDTHTFESIPGVPTDPAAVTVQYNVNFAGIVSPTTTLTYAGGSTPAAGIVTRNQAGVYEVSFDTTLLPGYWWWKWTGNSPGQDVMPSSAIVFDPAPITPTGRTFGAGLVGSGSFGGN